MKVDLENKYFHGLAGGIPFWEEREILEIGLKQLQQIVDLKGIYSRKYLAEKGIIYKDKEPVYNGDEYISICTRKVEESEFSGQFSGTDSAFFRYVRFKIAIALKLDEKDSFKEGDYKHLPGERQIKDGIDISKFLAITVGIEGVKNRERIAQKIRNIIEGYDIPITDIDGNVLEFSKEEMLEDDERER